MVDLTGKKVLIIGIGFYDYEETIRQAIENRGAIVSFVNSCKKDFWTRLYRRLGLEQCAKRRAQKCRDLQWKATLKDNDVVFVIKGANLTQPDIDVLRGINPHAKFILYLWDSLVRHDNIELLLKNFDNILSFDRIDCEKNPQLKFRPLFYRKRPSPQPKEYDLSFIGWLHSDRLHLLRALREQLKARHGNYYFKLYTGRFTYWVWRYLKGSLGPEDRELITLKTIPYDEFQRVTAASHVVLDIAHPLQSGLTIRTLETLAANSVLLTTNRDISNYKEIAPSSYCLLDRENPVIPERIDQEMQSLSDYFSLESFIDEIFSIR